MAAKFFSPQWCAQALLAQDAAAAEITGLFKDAAAFTHVLALDVSDRPDVVAHLRYEAGKCVALSPDSRPEDEVWIRFSATLEHWQSAASGSVPASKLVMTGKMKLTKGALKDVVANQNAFDRIVACFSTIDTDWQI